MLPGNPSLIDITATNRYLVAPFQTPDNRASATELVDYEYGGIALQDPSKGLKYQIWKGWWDATDATVYLSTDDDSATPIAIFTESDVIEFTFTFDQNMRWAAATRLVGNVLHFRWYDTAAESYVTSVYTGISSVRLALDDKRDMQVQFGVTDMILTYVRAGQVCWRIQRDRFLTEYTHSGFIVPDSIRITHFGMSKINRLQWRLGPRRGN